MRLTILTLLCLLPVAALAQPPQSAQQKRVEVITVQRRLALVIGNGTYQNLLRIPQSLNDADDMAAALRALGFSVTEYKDLQIEPLIRAVTSFRATIQPADLALVYYSGHGGQWGEENYLLPVDYEPPAPQEAEFVARRALPMSMIRDGLERNARVRVLIFDACRSSPLLSSKDTPGGLQRINIRPEGTLVAYASADQQGSGFHTDRRNSDYTEQLLKSLRAPQLPDIKSVFEQVQIQVYEASNKSQTPYIYGFLSGPLYLGNAPPAETATRPAPAETIDLDLERYTAVKESRDPDQLESVANKLHRADLAEILRERAQAMRSVAAPPPSMPNPNNGTPAPNLDQLTKHAGDAFDRKDYTTAFPDYVKLAQSGDALAMARLAYMYDVGQGTEQNFAQARSWYTKAAQSGNSYAMFNLGVMYDNAHGVTRDYNQAYTWYRKGAEAGNANAMTNLAYLYESGHGVTLDYSQAVGWYRKASDAGQTQAMNNLGTLYELGNGVPKDLEQAKAWYRKAADVGNADARTNLDRVDKLPSTPAPAPKTELTAAEKERLTKRADDAYDRKDYTTAVPEYTKLAEANDTWAMSRLGYLYNRGLGVKRDDTQGAYWLRKAADNGNAHSMYNLAVLYGSGQGVPQDYNEAVTWYRKAAEGGDVDGMAGLAYMYSEGHGVTQDFGQAMTWYRKAADLGNAWAMNNIGTLYQNGQGTPKDLDQAGIWYRKAVAAGNEDARGNLSRLPGTNNSPASNTSSNTSLGAAEKDQITKRADDAYDRQDYASAVPEYRKLALAGDVWGMSRLGYLYDRGLGIRQDDVQSAYWLRKAAEAGNVHSMYNLAVLYGSGKGVAQDFAQAVNWYRKAADAGDVDGMAGLAFMYSNGHGVPQDYSQALSWYRKAADEGNAWAMNNLATLYENGQGVSKDIEQAVTWYRKAANAGNEDAKGNLKRLGR
jgi:TPR repeat protein